MKPKKTGLNIVSKYIPPSSRIGLLLDMAITGHPVAIEELKKLGFEFSAAPKQA